MTAESSSTWVAVTPEPLALDPLVAWATRPGCGAVVTFAGTVRDHSDDHDQVIALEYETSEPLALARLRGVAEAAQKRWPDLAAVALHHRVGRVELGEATVLVVVAAPHRAEAFEAGRYCIDALKRSVPMWKREHFEGGSAWSSATEPIVAVEST
ncbi:MAG: molybdenum cofactor biosynthesis protein MoaE [Acidimicrobiales bacterium]